MDEVDRAIQTILEMGFTLADYSDVANGDDAARLDELLEVAEEERREGAD